MYHVQAEMVGPLRVADLRKEAERERLLAVAGDDWPRPVVGWIGRQLVRAGTRLEAAGRPCRVELSFTVVPDACGCGN